MNDNWAWYICDWDELYEVSSDGRAWKPGDKKRKAALLYTRSPTYGPKHDNVSYEDAAEITEEITGDRDAWIGVFGVFEKLREVTGWQIDDFRGFLLGKGASRISARTLERKLCASQELIKRAMEILSDPRIAWIVKRELPSRILAKRAVAVFSEPLITETETEYSTDTNQKEKKTEEGDSCQSPKDGCEAPPAAPANNSEMSVPLPSVSDSEDQQRLTIGRFVLNVEKLLGLSRHDHKQNASDDTTFRRMGEKIANGDYGDPEQAIAAVYERAREIGQDPGCKKPAAVLLFRCGYMEAKT